MQNCTEISTNPTDENALERFKPTRRKAGLPSSAFTARSNRQLTNPPKPKPTKTMKIIYKPNLLAAALVGVVAFTATIARAADPLASWNDGPAKQAIVEFVRATTTQGSPQFVPPEERIATFDQDGTLWVEHPMYTQVTYCLEGVPALVEKKPELKNREPFKTVLSGNREAMAKLSRTRAFNSGFLVEDRLSRSEYDRSGCRPNFHA